MKSLYLELPIKTVSELNRRDHWATRQRRVRAQRDEVNIEMKNAIRRNHIQLPCLVVLTRIGAKVLDSDNLASALKAVRDEVANVLGASDTPTSPAQFEYRQRAIGKHEYKVIIEVQSL